VIKLASSVMPYTVLFTDTTFVSTNGDVAAVFPSAILNSSFYIVIEHRNSIQTWSANAVLADQSVINYDFTNAISKAFGNNLADNGDGTFSLFSGDVNKDGQIDNSDYQMLENGVNNFIVNYNLLDLTGDNILESADFSIIENNFSGNISIEKP